MWIVAATNRDLEAMLANGQFRADLYFRLNGFPITLPPLRERGSDIPLLVQHFLTLFARELGKPAIEVSPEAMELLVGYAWPGNVRELQSVLRQAILQATGPVLLREFLPAQLRKGGRCDLSASAPDASQTHPLEVFFGREIQRGTQSLYAETIALVERLLLTRVFRDTSGNQSHAAKTLGITRSSLRNKMREYGICITYSG